MSGARVPISDNGRLSYFVYEERGRPFIERLDWFLNWYTAEELQQVRELNIDNRNPATGEVGGMRTTEGIARLPNLREIRISASGITKVVGLSALSDLERISLLDNRIEELSGIGDLLHLRTISLIGNPIDSLYDIEASEYLMALRIDRTGITTLDGIGRFPSLAGLGANGNALTDVTALASLEKLEGVEMISSRNDLNEESLELLNEMKRTNSELYIEWERPQ